MKAATAKTEIDSDEVIPLMMERWLRSIIESEAFQIYLQPQVSCVTGEITGVEVLSRLFDVNGRTISPMRFVSLIEHNELCDVFLRRILSKVAETVEFINGYTVAVNISAKQVRPALAEIVADFLNTSGFPAKKLVLEITESALLKDSKEVNATLSALSDAEVKIYIDDFGNGYSCLNYLKLFHVDGIKFPKEYIKDIHQTHNLKIVDGLCRLAKSLGLKVVAEGVETVQQKDLVAVLGCDDYQGYFHSRPMPALDFCNNYAIQK